MDALTTDPPVVSATRVISDGSTGSVGLLAVLTGTPCTIGTGRAGAAGAGTTRAVLYPEYHRLSTK